MSNTWQDLENGEISSEFLLKIEEALARASSDSKRLETELRSKADGERDGQLTTLHWDPNSQPPVDPGVILSQICNEYVTSLGQDFKGSVRINMREKGNTRNVYASFSRQIVPGDDDDHDDEMYDVDDDDDFVPDHPQAQRFPHIPAQRAQPTEARYATYQGPNSWRGAEDPFPAVQMGGGHSSAAAYERRRAAVAASEVQLNEPISELLMAPQWHAVLQQVGLQTDRLLAMNETLVAAVANQSEVLTRANESIIHRVLDTQMPLPSTAGGGVQQLPGMLGKLLKLGGKKMAATSSPTSTSWGSAGGSDGGGWSQPPLDLPSAHPSEFGDEDDDEFSSPSYSPAPAPRPSGDGGAAAALPGNLAQSIRQLAAEDPGAAKALVLDVKDDLAEAMGVDPEMLDLFLDGDE